MPANGPVPVEPGADISAPIDIEHLRRYTFGDQALEKEILSLFLAQIPETMKALRAASNQRDWKVAAHTLKGSCRAVGAFALGDIAQDVEHLTYGADSETCKEAISRLDAAASEARTFIQATYGLG
jgi:HPt (histidine-containing phosphotransfer) domain-containing protein